MSDYKWAFAGIIEKPHYVPISCFNYRIKGNHSPNKFPSGIITPITKARKWHHGLYIFRANFRGNNLGSVIIDENGKYVSTTCWDYIYTIPEYRGMGISPELIAEDILTTIERWVTRRGGSEDFLTNPVSIKVLEKARKLMLERGAITHENV